MLKVATEAFGAKCSPGNELIHPIGVIIPCNLNSELIMFIEFSDWNELTVRILRLEISLRRRFSEEQVKLF